MASRLSRLPVVVGGCWTALVLVNWGALHLHPRAAWMPGAFVDGWRDAWGGCSAFVIAITGHLGAAAVAALIFTAGAGAGRVAWLWLGVPARARAAAGPACRGLTRLIAGLAALGGGVLGLGLTGLLYAPVLGVLVAAGVALPICAALNHRRGTRARRIAGRPDFRWIIGPVIVIGALCALDLPAALAPESFYDAIGYHLAVPEAFLRAHRIGWPETPWLAALPLGVEMLYLTALSLQGESAARLLNLASLLLAAGAVGAIAIRLADGRRIAGWLAAALFLAAPVAGREAESAFTDALPALAALLAARWSLAGVGGLRPALACLAAASAAKYPALGQGAVFALLALGLAGSGRRIALLLEGAGWLGACLGPWLVKNWLLTGDPVYPLLADHGWGFRFPPGGLDHLATELRSYGRDPAGGLAALALLPWDTVMHDLDGRYWSETYGPGLLCLLPAAGAWLARDPGPAGRRVAFLATGWCLVWSATCRLSRYLLPALGLLCAIAGACALADRRRPAHRAMLAGAALWLAFAPFDRMQYRVAWNIALETWAPVTGRIPLPRWRTAHLQGGAAHDWLGGMRAERPRVLLVFMEQAYGSPVPWLGAHLYDEPWLSRAVRRASTRARLRIALRQRGITHVLRDDGGMARHAMDLGQPRTRAVLDDFLTKLGSPAFRSGTLRGWVLPRP